MSTVTGSSGGRSPPKQTWSGGMRSKPHQTPHEKPALHTEAEGADEREAGDTPCNGRHEEAGVAAPASQWSSEQHTQLRMKRTFLNDKGVNRSRRQNAPKHARPCDHSLKTRDAETARTERRNRQIRRPSELPASGWLTDRSTECQGILGREHRWSP